ncbi:Nucleus export protein brr6 [Spathaspora sp. JA1]|nr:Nucleus export protein brr6 [Spathaspora sp. JA1]
MSTQEPIGENQSFLTESSPDGSLGKTGINSETGRTSPFSERPQIDLASPTNEQPQLHVATEYPEINTNNHCSEASNVLIKKKSCVEQTLTPLNSDGAKKNSVIRELIVDPRVPYTLSLYLQLISNAVLVSILFYIIYNVITTLKGDINHKIETATSEILQEISFCSREYVRNKCSPENGLRVPALEQECTELDKCRNRDPQLIARSKITAETFAEIINGFIGKISWKSMILINMLVLGGLVITNVIFVSYRSQWTPLTSKEDQDKIITLENKVREQELKIREFENKSKLQLT